jgi:hypothetical protein
MTPPAPRGGEDSPEPAGLRTFETHQTRIPLHQLGRATSVDKKASAPNRVRHLGASAARRAPGEPAHSRRISSSRRDRRFAAVASIQLFLRPRPGLLRDLPPLPPGPKRARLRRIVQGHAGRRDAPLVRHQPDPALENGRGRERAGTGRARTCRDEHAGTGRAVGGDRSRRSSLNALAKAVVDLPSVADGNDQNLDRLFHDSVNDAGIAGPLGCADEAPRPAAPSRTMAVRWSAKALATRSIYI